MATVNNGNLTILDHIKRQRPDGSIEQDIVEQMSMRRAVMMDAVWKEGNLPTGHRVTARTALPGVGTGIGWRKYNEGVSKGKSATTQFDETCGMMAGSCVCDVDLAKLNGDERAFRMSEDRTFVEAFNNELETGFFYHSTKTAPEKFMGLSPRFDSTTSPGGSQILLHDAAASGADSSSIWIVGWGDHSVYFTYPKGSAAGGLRPKDFGEIMTGDGQTPEKFFPAYVTYWSWQVGLVVEDFRYITRIANVDATTLSSTGMALYTSLVSAVEEKMQDVTSVKPVIYCNRTVASFLRKQAISSTVNSTLTYETVAGKPVTMLSGIPIRVTDALIKTESPVT